MAIGGKVALKNMKQLMMCLCIMAHHMRVVHGISRETCMSLLDFYKKTSRSIFCGIQVSSKKTTDDTFAQDTETIERETGVTAVESTITTYTKKHPLSNCTVFNALTHKPLTPWCINKLPLDSTSILKMIVVWNGIDRQIMLLPQAIVGNGQHQDSECKDLSLTK